MFPYHLRRCSPEKIPPATYVSVSFDAKYLAIGADDGSVWILATVDGMRKEKISRASCGVTSMAWHPDTLNWLFVGYSDGASHVIRMPKGPWVC